MRKEFPEEFRLLSTVKVDDRWRLLQTRADHNNSIISYKMFLKTFWIATRVAITNIFAIIIIKLFWGRIKWQLLRCTFGTRDCLTMTVLLAGWVALLCQPCHPCSGIKLVKAVPQEAQLPHLPPGQPGGTLASGFQQPGGCPVHNH